MTRTRRFFALIPLALLMGVVPAAQSACDSVEPTLVVSGFALDDVDIQVKTLGALDEDAVETLRTRKDVDVTLRLPAGACEGPCRFAEVSVYVVNNSAHAIAPPVVRTRAPTSRAARAPLAFPAVEISPHRTGRLRAVVELWPEEQTLDAHLSASVFMGVTADAVSESR